MATRVWIRVILPVTSAIDTSIGIHVVMNLTHLLLPEISVATASEAAKFRLLCYVARYDQRMMEST